MTDTTAISQDTEARLSALDVGRSFMVKAPAGSGKTTLITQRVLACLATVGNPEEVMAITFTNKAANEMRSRLAEALQLGSSGVRPTEPNKQRTYDLAQAVLQRDEQLKWGLRQNAARLRVMTIDSLNGFIARMAPVVSGLGGGANIDESPDSVYREAVLALIAELDSAAENDTLYPALKTVLGFASNRVETLIPILTAMLKKRDQWLPLVVNRARSSNQSLGAEYLVGRIVDSMTETMADVLPRSPIYDIVLQGHAAGVFETNQFLSGSASLDFWKAIATKVLTKEGAFRKKFTKAEGFIAGKETTHAANEALALMPAHSQSELCRELLEDVLRLPSPHDLINAEQLVTSISLVLRQLVAHLSVAFQKAGVVDFLEVSIRAVAALRGDTGQVPLAERMDYIIRHLLVDEAQDTSASQYQLLETLTETWQQDDGRTLFIVGDPQQSVYSFREAEVRLFVEMWGTRILGHVPLETVELRANFRSRPEIIDFCNTAFTQIFPQADNLLDGAVSYSPATATRDPGGKVSLHAWDAPAPQEEAVRIAEICKTIIANDDKQTIAVLARGRAGVKRVVAELKKAGVTYSCQDIDELSETDTVRDIVGLIRSLWHEGDRTAWGTLLRAPFVGLTWEDMLTITRGRTKGSLVDAARAALPNLTPDGQTRVERLMDAIKQVRREMTLAGDLADQVEALWNYLGGPACVTPEQLEDARSTFALLRTNLVGGTLESVEDFERGLSKLYAAPGVGKVEIMTIHKSKGLEYDHVFLAGLWRKERADDKPLLSYRHIEHGVLMAPRPLDSEDENGAAFYNLVNRLNTAARRAEDLRVLYVAATRAREHLYVMCCTHNGAAPALTLLSPLWPALRDQIDPSQVLPVQPEPPPAPEPFPLSPRLPASWTYPQKPLGYRAPSANVIMPSELVVRDSLPPENNEASANDRITGIIFHQTLRYLCERGLQGQYQQVKEQMERSMRSGMRRMGMPEPAIAQGIDRVHALVLKTAVSTEGQWVLQDRAIQGNERRIAGYKSGSWISGSIDRYFVENGTVHVVDYKSGGYGLTGSAWDRFVSAQTMNYAPQILSYMDVMKEAMQMPVKGYLLFSENPTLVDVC